MTHPVASVTRTNQRGAVAVETVLIVPVVLLVLGVMVAGWRIWDARSQVQSSADAAARAASIVRSAATARQHAHLVAASNLRTGNVECQQPGVAVNTSGFSVPVGQPAQVEVTISCTVPLSDLLVPGLPGALQVTKSATAPLDRHKQRSP